jgi:cytochrome c5
VAGRIISGLSNAAVFQTGETLMSEARADEPSGPIKNWRQLLVLAVAAFVVPVLLIIAVVQLITGGLNAGPGHPNMSEEAIAARIKPVGQVNLGGPGAEAPAVAATAPAPAAGAPAKARSGSEVYQSVCAVCHGAGVAGAPKTADAGAWKPRLAQGKPTLYTHAIQGFKMMPAKGGNTSLSDAEVKAAVDYIAAQAK